MALTQEEVSQLYVTIFNRASEKKGNEFWQGFGGGAALTRDQVATTMLGTAAAAEYFGTSLDTDQDFIEHIYLNTLNKTFADDPTGIGIWVTQLETTTNFYIGQGNSPEVSANLARGTTVRQLIDEITKPSRVSDAKDQFNNRVQVSNDTVDILNTAPFGTDREDGGTDRDYLRFDKDLTVTHDPATILSANAYIYNTVSFLPLEFTLTGRDTDSFLGNNGDDTTVGTILNAFTDVHLGDSFDGSSGYDTFSITTDIVELVMEDNIVLNNVEQLYISNFRSGWESVDIANQDFEDIVLDASSQISTVDVSNINATSAISLLNFRTLGDTQSIGFTDDLTSSLGSTGITIGGASDGGGPLNINSSVLYQVATTVITTINLTDITQSGGAGNFVHRLSAPSVTDVGVNTTFNIDNVLISNAGVLNAIFEVEQSGGSHNISFVNLSDIDNVNTRLMLDQGGVGSGTSPNDAVRLTLDNVQNTDAMTQFSVDHAEIVYIDVLSSSALEAVLTGTKANPGIPASVYVNTGTEGDTLTVETWSLREPVGDTTFIITGDGDLTIGALGTGGSEIIIDGFTATGDINLDNISAKATSITTGSGIDTLVIGGGAVDIQTSGGADIVNVLSGGATLIYALSTDSQLNTLDIITGFQNDDAIELASSLMLFSGEVRNAVLQKGNIAGTGLPAIETFIGDGENFFFDQPDNTNRATAFATDDAGDGLLFVDADNNGNFSEAEDMVIQLVGVTTLTIDDIEFA